MHHAKRSNPLSTAKPPSARAEQTPRRMWQSPAEHLDDALAFCDFALSLARVGPVEAGVGEFGPGSKEDLRFERVAN